MFGELRNWVVVGAWVESLRRRGEVEPWLYDGVN